MKLKSFLLSFSSRPLWQQFLMLLAADTLLALLGALLLRNWVMVSNVYFISSGIFLIIAIIPVFTEMGSSVKLTGRALKKDEKVAELLKEKQSCYERGARTTYAFGLAGIAAFILAFLTIGLG